MNQYELIPAVSLLIGYVQLLLAISVFVERSSEVLFEFVYAFGLSSLLPKTMSEEEKQGFGRFLKRACVFLVAIGYSMGFDINFPLFELHPYVHVALGALFLSFGAELLHNILAFLEKAKEYWRDAANLRQT